MSPANDVRSQGIFIVNIFIMYLQCVKKIVFDHRFCSLYTFVIKQMQPKAISSEVYACQMLKQNNKSIIV